MAWWTLRNQHEDRAELVVEMYKDSRILYVHEPHAWGEIHIETVDDAPPDIDLQNLDGFNILNFDCENWEGGDYLERGGVEFTSPDELADEELSDLHNAYEDGWISGLSELGWSDAGEQQWWLHGPLQLEDEDGNIIALGDEQQEED